jgi:virulence factor
MISTIIQQTRRLRTNAQLSHPYTRQYAFVGMGSHSMSNLYPVLNLLRVPLKYICVTSPRKARLISRNPFYNFGGTTPSSSLSDVLSDPGISAVFVSASPAAHFRIASSVLRQGKSLFIEKPPCHTLAQLESLIALQTQTDTLVQVGMQKRYAPSIRRLKARLKNDSVCNYSLRYCVGRYPEGKALTELFIHPIDLSIHLFGPADIIALRQASSQTLVLMLAHGNTVGTMELSTGYSWTTPIENLSVHTRKGLYKLTSIDTLTFVPASTPVAGLPWEKIKHPDVSVEHLCHHDSFSPTLASSLWVEHGFYHELKDFVDGVEHTSPILAKPFFASKYRPTLQSLLPTYRLLEQISRNQASATSP